MAMQMNKKNFIVFCSFAVTILLVVGLGGFKFEVQHLCEMRVWH